MSSPADRSRTSWTDESLAQAEEVFAEIQRTIDAADRFIRRSRELSAGIDRLLNARR